jgi:hypothetical protein
MPATHKETPPRTHTSRSSAATPPDTHA